MLQLPAPELKMGKVSISRLTRQLYTVTGRSLTPVCSKHLSPCTCIFSYPVSTAWLCQPQTSQLWPGSLTVPLAVQCPESLFWRRAIRAMEKWCGDTEKQQDNPFLCSPISPAPAWCQAAVRCRICASPRKHSMFPTSNFCSSLHLLIHSCTSYCKAVLTIAPALMLTSSSAGNIH